MQLLTRNGWSRCGLCLALVVRLLVVHAMKNTPRSSSRELIPSPLSPSFTIQQSLCRLPRPCASHTPGLVPPQSVADSSESAFFSDIELKTIGIVC